MSWGFNSTDLQQARRENNERRGLTLVGSFLASIIVDLWKHLNRLGRQFEDRRAAQQNEGTLWHLYRALAESEIRRPFHSQAQRLAFVIKPNV